MYSIAISEQKFWFDEFGQPIGKQPLTFGWARRMGVWNDLFPFPDDSRTEDDLEVHAGLLWPGLLEEAEV